MGDVNAAVAQFMDVTGASREAAKFFLDSSGGVVDAAVDQFFATGGRLNQADAPAGDDDDEFVDAQPELAAVPGALTSSQLEFWHAACCTALHGSCMWRRRNATMVWEL